MHRRTSFVMVAFISSAALIAGCGSSSSSGGGGSGGGSVGTGSNNSSQAPAAELASAVTALGNTSTLTAAIKLGATASQISALAKANGTSLTSAETNAIAGAEISIEASAPSGKTLGDLGGGTGPGAVDFTISDNGTNFISIRSVNKTLYLQADLKDLLNTFGKGSIYASLQAESAQLPSFIQALFAGKWISLPESAAKSLEGSLGGGAASASANPAQQQKFIQGLKTILTNDVKVTRASSGGTDKLDLSANLRTIVTAFLSTISSAVPAAGSALSAAKPSSVPNENVALTASVTGGALSELSIDLGQFDHKGKVSFPLDVLFTRGGSAITAPSGAVAVNTQQLGQLFGGLAGGLGG
jgi:hypothetical protein